ncbi:MAG: ATP synthase F1 subunit gamma [Candidatus Eiseniibacteriota bacterium]
MAKAKVLLKRRKSVRNTKKITRTMEMVSTAKYKQSHGRIASSAPYQRKLREMMADLATVSADITHPLLVSRPVKRSLVLLVTSSRGLCGGYNSNLNVLARRLVEKEREAGAAVELEIIGKKGIVYFRHRKQPIARAHDHFGDKAGYAEINALAETYIERYSKAEIDRFTVVFQKFYSAGRQAPVAEVLLPLATISAGAAKPVGGASAPVRPKTVNYLFSPEPESLMRELLPAYFKTTLFADFLQAVVGEHLARMVAMKNATDASDKLIKRLTRMYNRARQTQITNEISELMGGVEALK